MWTSGGRSGQTFKSGKIVQVSDGQEVDKTPRPVEVNNSHPVHFIHPVLCLPGAQASPNRSRNSVAKSRASAAASATTTTTRAAAAATTTATNTGEFKLENKARCQGV